MASTSSPAESPNNQQMMNIGTQCADPLCRLVDFLPFKCQHCSKLFCQEHFKVEAHKCTEYDEFKHNRVAPDCPFCHTPVAVPPGQDPNVRLEQHFEKECSVLTGKTKSKTTPTCARGTCKKVLFSPIRCDTCRQQFCPAHRFPSDHTCKAPQSRLLNNNAAKPSSTTTARREPVPSFAASATAKDLNAKATSAMANVKKGVAAAAASSSSAAAKASLVAGPGMIQQKKTDRLLAVGVSAVTPSSSTVISASATPAATTTTTDAIPNRYNESETGPTPVISFDVQSFVPRSIFGTA